MSPIIGIIASSISGNIATNSYESIATVTVGAGGSSSISFSSIPSTYKHLQIRLIAFEANDKLIRIRANSDTGANYTYHALEGNGSSASASGGASKSALDFMYNYAASGYSANSPTVGIIDILDYQNTNKYKTVRSLGAIDYNGAGVIRLESGAWLSTSAISTITLDAYNAGTFAQYSSFALYGVK